MGSTYKIVGTKRREGKMKFIVYESGDDGKRLKLTFDVPEEQEIGVTNFVNQWNVFAREMDIPHMYTAEDTSGPSVGKAK